MYCAYHISSVARVRCSSCTRPLCQACDHRIKGYAYCQDCIVAGIQNLSQSYHKPRSKGRARIAALFALIPGMGAVYNRQNIKGVVHFVTIVGLFQLTSIRIGAGFFALGGIAAYLYSIIDSYRTAIRIGRGESPAADEERFKRALIKKAPLIGLVLIFAGAMLAIQVLRPFPFITLARLFPVGLIFLGGYLLTRYFKRNRDAEYGEHTQPYSLIPGGYDDHSREQSSRFSRSAGRR
jgi:hypothetical protein